MKKKRQNPGLLLSEALEGEESQTQAAKNLGVSPAMVNNLIHGKKRPGLDLAIRIQELYGIEPSAW